MRININIRTSWLLLRGTIWIVSIFILTSIGIESAGFAQKIDAAKAEEIIKQASTLSQQGHCDEVIRLLGSALPEIEKQLGENHVSVGHGLVILGRCFKAKSQLKEAESAWKRSIAILEKAEPLAVAPTVEELAGLYWDIGQYKEAELLIKRSLEIREKGLGPEHPDVAESLNDLALVYHDTGRYAEAEPLYKRALEIWEKALGPKHLDVATALNNLAELYREQSRYAEAEPLYKRALEIREQALGLEHPDVATALNNLAILYHETSKYAEAEPLYKRSLEISEKVLGPEHPDVATSLNNLAVLYRQTSKYADAELLCKRALEIYEKKIGPEHPDVARSLNSLALVYYDSGRYSEAEPLYKRSLEIREKALGPEHPDVAESLNNLAELYHETGRFPEAVPLYKRALEIHEKAFGVDHPDVATSLNNLASIYIDMGRYAEVEPLFKRALEIREKALGPGHPGVATSLNNLAELYRRTGRYPEAEPLFKRALEIREKALGPGHPGIGAPLNNLAALYRQTGKYSEAELLFKRALAIFEKTLGPEHPDVAAPLNNLANVYNETHRYSAAEPLYKRALEIREKSVGPEHPDVSTSLRNLAFLNVYTGKYDTALAYFVRCLNTQALHRNRVLNGLSERHQLAFVQTQQMSVHAMLSYILQYMQEDVRAVQDAMDSWLKWKGVVLEAQSRYMAMVMKSEDFEVQASWKKLQEVRQYLARMIMAGPDKMKFTPATYQTRLKEQVDKVEELEAALSRKSAPFALEKRIGQVDVGRLARMVGTDGVYIDFAKVSMYDFLKNNWTEEHYGVLILVPKEAGKYNLHLLDLGKTEEIDKMIRIWREQVDASNKYEMLKVGLELYRKIFKPMEQWLKGRKRLVMSLDGELHMLPMEALAMSKNKKSEKLYLMDHWEVVYVPTGRDIGRWEEPVTESRAAIVMADPDYDLGLDERKKVKSQLNLPTIPEGPNQIVRGNVSEDLNRIRFDRLDGTQKEGHQIAETLVKAGNDVQLYMGEQAIEEILENLSGARLIHLATHGFFLANEEAGLREEIRGKSQVSLYRQGEDWSKMDGVVGEHPLLRSGVVLAGANSSLDEGRDEGILHGMKVQGLRLWGTDLVVLSACETGLGVVQAGEGVFGLQRSFILAGARTLIVSLWKVDDEATAFFMSEFYKARTEGASKVEALARARRAVRNHPDHPEWNNPFYWAAFILVGAPN